LAWSAYVIQKTGPTWKVFLLDWSVSRNLLFDFKHGADYMPVSPVRDTVKQFSSGALPTVCHPHQHSPKWPQIPARFCNTSLYRNPLVNKISLLTTNPLPDEFQQAVAKIKAQIPS
jgi:hypothetical protein